MIEGRMKKFFKEITLLGQTFIKNPDLSVNDLLNESNAEIISFKRYEVGEGIEKKKKILLTKSWLKSREVSHNIPKK